jgi:taurine dioxygenase
LTAVSACPDNAAMMPRVNRIGEALGAEVVGADFSRAIDDAAFAVVRQALLDHLVVAVRAQNLPPESHIAFSARFGPLEEHDNKRYLKDGHPEILILSNGVDAEGQPIGVPDAGDSWHSDHSFKRLPALCTLLQAVKLPQTGGDTEFVNLYRAYESLSESAKRRIAGRKGLHTVNKLRNPRATMAGTRPDAKDFYERQSRTQPDVAHPLVRTHPETGRKLLYCSPRFTIGIEGMADGEAQPLLDELFAAQLAPAHRYRHEWRPGDLLIWDNRSVNHRATGGYALPDVRLMHRTTVLGDAPY